MSKFCVHKTNSTNLLTNKAIGEQILQHIDHNMLGTLPIIIAMSMLNRLIPENDY